jgi:hypothetical protein
MWFHEAVPTQSMLAGAKSIVNIAAGMVVGGGSASILGEKRGAAAKSPRSKKGK